MKFFATSDATLIRPIFYQRWGTFSRRREKGKIES
jgi:hypothetical protein